MAVRDGQGKAGDTAVHRSCRRWGRIRRRHMQPRASRGRPRLGRTWVSDAVGIYKLVREVAEVMNKSALQVI